MGLNRPTSGGRGTPNKPSPMAHIDTQVSKRKKDRNLLLVCVDIAKNRLYVKSMIPDFERGMMPLPHIV